MNETLLEVSANDAHRIAVARYHRIPPRRIRAVYAIFQGETMLKELKVEIRNESPLRFKTLIPVDQFALEYGT
jgi:hypothetical protein